jgi:hypothetical protein
MRNGDFSVRLPGSWTGLAGKTADTFNEIVAANQQMAEELTAWVRWLARKKYHGTIRFRKTRPQSRVFRAFPSSFRLQFELSQL